MGEVFSVDYKDRIIAKVADKACKKICRKTIRYLQGLKDDCLQSGDDTPLENIWDEVCVQIQGEMSNFWECIYLEEIRRVIFWEVADLEEEVKQAIWFQTTSGFYWDEDDEEEDGLLFDDDEIIEYIINDYLLREAGNWTNKRIEKYLE